MKKLRRTLSRLYGDYAVLHDAQNLATTSGRVAAPGKSGTGDCVPGVSSGEFGRAGTEQPWRLGV